MCPPVLSKPQGQVQHIDAFTKAPGAHGGVVDTLTAGPHPSVEHARMSKAVGLDMMLLDTLTEAFCTSFDVIVTDTMLDESRMKT